MKLLSFRSALGTALIALLAACGGQSQDAGQPALQTAAVMQTVAVGQADQAAPVPDCAPQHCEGLRIIDGNAEAFRVDAQRRAALDAEDGVPQA